MPIICLHTAYDVQGSGVDPLIHLQDVRAAVQCKLAIAGGINLQNVRAALDQGADIVVVGGGIAAATDSRKTAKQIKETIATATPHVDTT